MVWASRRVSASARAQDDLTGRHIEWRGGTLRAVDNSRVAFVGRIG